MIIHDKRKQFTHTT